MDISKLTHGAKVVLGGTIAFLIVSFFNWFESYAESGSRTCGTASVSSPACSRSPSWCGRRFASPNEGRGAASSGNDRSAARRPGRHFRVHPVHQHTGWRLRRCGRRRSHLLGLARSGRSRSLIAVGAFLNMKGTGLTIADMKEQASDAMASAKSATDKSSSTETAAATQRRSGGRDSGCSCCTRPLPGPLPPPRRQHPPPRRRRAPQMRPEAGPDAPPPPNQA